MVGSGCGSVSRVVASKSWGLWFESSHHQYLFWKFSVKLYWKDENNEKSDREWPIFKRLLDKNYQRQICSIFNYQACWNVRREAMEVQCTNILAFPWWKCSVIQWSGGCLISGSSWVHIPLFLPSQFAASNCLISEGKNESGTCSSSLNGGSLKGKHLPGVIFAVFSRRRRRARGQCDQIGRYIALWQLFKACGKNYFGQIAHIFRQFL